MVMMTGTVVGGKIVVAEPLVEGSKVTVLAPGESDDLGFILSPTEEAALALQADLESRRRQRRLTEFLDQLDAEHGPVDEILVDKYLRLLG